MLKKVLAGLLTVIMLISLLPANIMIIHAEGGTTHTLTGQIVINSSNLSTYDNTTITGEYEFSSEKGSTNSPGITIDGVEAHLTIKDLNITTKFYDDSDPAPIALRNGATLYLTVEGANLCYATSSNAAGISVPKGCTLIITEASSGTLKAQGANAYGGGAGIGAPGNGYYVANGVDASSDTTTYTCGTIIINGGTIQAYGGTHFLGGAAMFGAAGIGNSYPGYYTNEDDVDFNNMGTGIIEINGGNVEAYGGASAAGIGGGACNSVESISINGGTINATPGDGGASIGMGFWLNDDSYTYNTVISINGGNITANGNIGYGSHNLNESGGNGTLSGGSVEIDPKADLNVSGQIRPNTNNYTELNFDVSIDDLLLTENKNVTTTIVSENFSLTKSGTLSVDEYNGTVALSCYGSETLIGKPATITIEDGENVWTANFTLSENNDISIGTPIYRVDLKFLSTSITEDIPDTEYTLSVLKNNGEAVSSEKIVIIPGIKKLYEKTGYITFYTMAGEYTVNFRTDDLNGGETISKTLIVSDKDTELVMLEETDDAFGEIIDLSYGDVVFGTEDGAGYVTYYDVQGQQKTVSALSYDTQFEIKQSNNAEATEHTIQIDGWSDAKAINITLNSIYIGAEAPIVIGENITANICLKGENKVGSINNGGCAILVGRNSVLNLDGTNQDKLTCVNNKTLIGTISGTINIYGGVITADVEGNGAAIGGFNYPSDESVDINIYGGIISVTSKYGAAIGTSNLAGVGHKGDTSYYGTVHIYGGEINATSVNGAAIGAGQCNYCPVNVYISGGTIIARTSATAAIGVVLDYSEATSTVCITGGNINSNKTVTATNGDVNGNLSVSCNELTIDGLTTDISITDADKIPDYYGFNDVQTIDGKLYLYLPADATLPENILSGEDNYIQHPTDDTKYILHEHILGYTISGTSIIENCVGADECGTAPTTITLSDPDANGTLMYNGEAYEADTTGVLASGATASIEYSSLTEGVSLVDGKPVNAGDYRVTMYLIDAEGNKIKDGNSNPISVSVEFTIEKATLTVTSYTAENRAFDGTDDIQVTEATLSGALGNDIVTIQLPVTATLVDEQGEPLMGGVADVTDNGYSKVLLPNLALAGSDKDNYIIEQPSGAVSLSSNVMIEKAEAPLLPAENITYTYGQTPTVERYSISLPEDCGAVSYSFEEDDSDNIISNIVVSDDGVLTYAVEEVDDYIDEITATVTVTAVMDNYQDATFTSSVTITDKKIQTLNANDISMTYGDADTTISVTGAKTELSYEVVEDSNANGDVVTVDASGKVSVVNAGTAKIRVTASSSDTYAEAVYEITVTVKQIPVTITAESYTVKEKDSLPTFEYKAEGLINGDILPITVNVACDATDTNTVGEYDIIVSGPESQGNYTYTYVNGVLEVLAADEAPFIIGDDGKMGWDAISDEIADAETGDEVVVDMNGATVVPGDIIEEARDKDITITFVVDEDVSWTIDGGTVTDGDIGDIDFGTTIESEDNPLNNIPVDVINNITGEKSTIEVNLAYSGEFGFTAILTTKLSSANAGYYANLFYYNPTSKELEYVCADVIADDGTAELTFTHASDYLIVIDDEDLGVVKDDDDATTEESAEATTEEPADATTEESADVTTSTETATTTENVTTTETITDKNTDDSAKTGDNTPLAAVMVMMMISVMGLIFGNKKKRNA